MSCNVTETGHADINIATSVLGAEVASAMKVKYDNPDTPFTGFNVKITGNHDVDVKMFAELHSPVFTEAFGYWTTPLSKAELEQGDSLINEFNLRKYPAINDMPHSLPTKLAMYKAINKAILANKSFGYLDSNNMITNLPQQGRETTPVIVKEGGHIQTVFGELIDDVANYKVIDHKMLNSRPVVEEDNQGYFVDTNTGRIRLQNHASPKLTLKNIKPVTFRHSEIKHAKHDANRVHSLLKDTFNKQGVNVSIKEDYELNGVASVEKNDDDTFTITYNPLNYTGDSIYHEFGHIYVDLLNDPAFIQTGINQLMGTELWKRIEAAYPHLGGLALGKEVLVTKIGEEAEALHNDPSNKRESSFAFWMRSFFQRLAKVFGITPNVAHNLAVDLVRGDLSRKINHRGDLVKQWRLDSHNASVMMVANQFMEAKQQQLNRIIRINKSNIDKAMYTAEASQMSKMLTQQLKNREAVEDASLLGAITKLTEHDIKMLGETEDVIDQMQALFSNIEDLTTLSNDEVISYVNKSQNIMVELNGFMHISELEEFSKADINALLIVDETGTQVQYTLKPNLSEEGQVLGKVIIEIQNIRNNMATRVNSAKVRAERISDYAMAAVIAQSSNPEMARNAMEMLKNGLVDEKWFQKYFMNNFDSNNGLVANVAKVDRRIAIDMKHERQRKLLEFERIYKGVTPEMVKSLTINNEGNATRKFVSEFDSDQFFKDIKEATKGYSDEARQAIIDSHLKETYTQEQIETAIEDKRVEFKNNEAAFNRWIYDNVEIVDGKPAAKLLGEFAVPKDEYLSKRYAEIMSDPKSKEYELLNYFLTELKDLTKHQSGLIQYHGGLPIIDSKKTEKNGEEILLYDEFGNKIHTIRFRNVGDTFKGKLLKYPKMDVSVENKEEWEAKTIKFVRQRYGLNFDTMDDIYEYNSNIRTDSKTILDKALSYDMGVVFPEFIKSSLEHKYKTEVEKLSLLALHKLETSQLQYRNNAGDKVANAANPNADGSRRDTQVNAKNSNVLARFKKDMEMKLYGEFIKDNKTNYALQEARNYVALVGLGFNVQAAAKNRGMGEVQLRLEAKAGIQYNSNDLAKARSTYGKNRAAFQKDKHRDNASNKTSALLKYFEVLDEYTEIIEQSHDLSLQRQGDDQNTLLKNKYTKEFNKMAFGLTNLVEHALHNKVLLAMMYSHRVITNEDGTKSIISRHDFVKKITGQRVLNPTRLKDKAYTDSFIEQSIKDKESAESKFEKQTTPLTDVFEFKNGIVEVKTENGKPIISKSDMADFELKVQGVNHKLHGIYNREDKGIIENLMIGQLIMQFKHWLPAMWVERYGTTGNPFNTQTTWNERRQEESIGNYNAIWKMVGKSTSNSIQQFRDDNGDVNPVDQVKGFIIGSLKFLANARVYYHSMNSYEQAAVMKAITEMMYAAGIYASILGVAAAVPDDKKDMVVYNFPMYVAKGVKQELTGLSPGYGWMENVLMTTKNPTATFGYAVDVMKLLARLGAFPFRDESNYFKSGRNKGELKALNSATRLTPGLVQYRKFQRFFEDDSNSVYTMFSF